jgi:Leucine-rich repeat (LRR) protein
LSSLQPLCLEDERSALLQFKDSFVINKCASPHACSKAASWTLEGEHGDCCLWDGVYCNLETGHVIELDLSDSCLYGSIKSNSSVFRLLQLQRLNLAHNDFNHSQIPSAVGNLLMLTSLNLSYSMFSGQIPSGVSHLSKLSSLDLSHNSDLYTQSDLGSLVQNLTSLEQLLLSFVNISSAVPESLANLSSLTTLDLKNCQLHGEFPTKVFQLPNLRVLRIKWNQNLIGYLPEFHSTSSLEVLTLGGTNFSGKLPTSIGNLSSLQVLRVQDCHFTGSIPSSLSNLTQLTDLDLFSNKLSGMLELDMFLQIKSLSLLILSHNNLTLLTKANSNDTLAQFHTLALRSCNLRKFPDFLRNQNKLSWLDLAGNNLRGLIPKWLYNTSLETLRVLLVSENFLIGFEQSPIVLSWSKLEILELGNNCLQGSLPIPQPSIKIFRVQKNLIREMSPLICNLSSPLVFDFSYNHFNGKLHPCLGNFSSLSVLLLQSNNFHGNIPKTWAVGSSLKMIDLSENQFQGQLPRSMANCMMLEYLHVGNNQINDTFPFWLGTLSQLKVLVLRFNGFHGGIKSYKTNYAFPELHIIDLSHNKISGKLPAKYFQHWNDMKVVDSNDQLIYMKLGFAGDGWVSSVLYKFTMTNKGIKLEYEKIQDVFKVIDFSSNKFEGEIPEVVGSLKGLNSLNLSNNALTGYIPPSLGNLTHIESMDLSLNKLLGEIPPQLTQLFSLESFNVSNNRLTGPIPHGNQFDTFENSSFGGNPELCGNPLSNKCGDFKYTQTPPSHFEENESSESPFEFGWKVVAIGYACGFVIGAVIGQIVIARNYDWFVRTFGKMQQTRRRVNWRKS